MIDIQIPILKEYNTTNAIVLANEIMNLRTFAEIAEWDKKTTVEMDVMRSVLRTIEGQLQNITQALEIEEQEHVLKSFLPKLFDGRKEQKRLLSEQARLTMENNRVENLIDQFETAIDFAPNSPADLKDLIKECKLRKKELQTKKKTVSAQMTSIRIEARQRSANTLSGKYGSWERQKIRQEKEYALDPHESEKSAVERQIIKLDRIIVWLERFK